MPKEIPEVEEKGKQYKNTLWQTIRNLQRPRKDNRLIRKYTQIQRNVNMQKMMTSGQIKVTKNKRKKVKVRGSYSCPLYYQFMGGHKRPASSQLRGVCVCGSSIQ